MATVTSKLHLVKNAIVDGLLLRANIIGPPAVQVASAYMGKDSKSESIQLASGDEPGESRQPEMHAFAIDEAPGVQHAEVRPRRPAAR